VLAACIIHFVLSSTWWLQASAAAEEILLGDFYRYIVHDIEPPYSGRLNLTTVALIEAFGAYGSTKKLNVAPSSLRLVSSRLVSSRLVSSRLVSSRLVSSRLCSLIMRYSVSLPGVLYCTTALHYCVALLCRCVLRDA
jgi:hypothetical protein